MSDFVDCPCCGYPTLTGRGAFEICAICWWEDDGQDDADAEAMRGGPNGALSLARARENFIDHYDCFEAGEAVGAVAEPSPERRMLLAYLRAVRLGERGYDPRTLYGLLRNEAEARRRGFS